MADAKHHPDNQIDDATLARYLQGTGDAADVARVERWLAADPAHRAELEVLRAAWSPAPAADADPDDQMWRWLAERMDEPLPGPRLVRAERRVWRGLQPAGAGYRRSALIAAALAIVVAGTLLFQFVIRSRSATDAAVVAPVAMRELATSRGERATGHLPDGSRVILGPDTRLRIPATFAATAGTSGVRDVHLEGEAFFEVTHDSARPFRVHTPTGIAEDLGTEFVVTAYPEARTTQVVVASGLVELRNRDADTAARPIRLALEAGDLGRVDAVGGSTLTRSVDVAAYTGWTAGRLVFDGVPLRDAIARLNRWYDLEIRVADGAIAARRFTATFHDEPVPQVLRVLEIALDVRAEQDGRVVTLRPMQSSPQ